MRFFSALAEKYTIVVNQEILDQFIGRFSELPIAIHVAALDEEYIFNDGVWEIWE